MKSMIKLLLKHKANKFVQHDENNTESLYSHLDSPTWLDSTVIYPVWSVVRELMPCRKAKIIWNFDKHVKPGLFMFIRWSWESQNNDKIRLKIKLKRWLARCSCSLRYKRCWVARASQYPRTKIQQAEDKSNAKQDR